MANDKVFLAGVADAYLFKGNQLMAVAKTLLDSSLTTEVSLEDIRAGKGAKLLGRYAHSSALNLEMNDVLFQLDYIAWNVGSKIETAGSVIEPVGGIKVGGSNKITVKGTPADFLSFGKIGWFSPLGADDWTTFKFDVGAKTATLPSKTKGGLIVKEGDEVCVQFVNDRACEQVTVSADFVPDEITVVLSADLFRASATGEVGDISKNATKVGKVEIEIPRLQLNGNVNMTLEMTGASNTSLSGTALATTNGLSCEESGYYARIKKCEFSADWREKVEAIVPAGGNAIKMSKSANYPLDIYAVIPSTNTSKLVSPLDLKYTPSGTGISVNNGVIASTSSSTGASNSVKVDLKNEKGDVVYATTTVNITITE